MSYFVLRGRCRDCGKPISIRYPIVESLTVVLFVVAYAKFGLGWPLLRALVFIGLLVVLAGIDFDHRLLPANISVAGLLIGFISALLPFFHFPLLKAFWGGVIGAGFILFAWALWRFVLARPFRKIGVNQKEGMGWGDLPFTAMIGVFVGPKGMAVGLAAAVLAGVMVGFISRWLGKTRAGQEIPFGPFLALGGLVGLFWGDIIFDLYLRLIAM